MSGSFTTGAEERKEAGRTVFARCLPWVIMAYLAWFAVYFAVERLHADASYFLMQVVDDGSFHVINGRWTIPLNQWPAVVGLELGAPMNVLIVLFSVGNISTLIASFLFTTLVLKDRHAGTALIMVQFLGLGHALFCPVFEMYQGAMLLVVFVATLRSQRLPTVWRLVLLAALFILVISSHFMGLIVMLMVLFLERVWIDRPAMILLLLLLGVHLWIRFEFLSTYEQNALSAVLIRLDRKGLAWLFIPGRIAAHVRHGLRAYPDTLLVALVTAAVLVVRKDGRNLFLFLGGLLVFYVALGLYLPDETHTQYREFVDYPVTVWVVILFWRGVLSFSGFQRVALATLLVAFGFRVVQPLWISVAYTQQVAWMRDRIAAAHHQDIRRGMLRNVPVFPTIGHDPPLSGLNPMEVILISSIDGPDAVVVLVQAKPNETITSFSALFKSRLDSLGMRLPEDRLGPYFDMPREDFRELR